LSDGVGTGILKGEKATGPVISHTGQ
jgi:hypothetical protein